jgi:predicted transcriptional regulator
MTNKQQMMVAIAASLTTLAETSGASESMIYMGACNMDIHFWNQCKTIMLQAGWIKVSANFVTITEEGKKIAAELEKALDKRNKL